MTLTDRARLPAIALCALFLWIANESSAASLGGHCSNWMTSSLNDEGTGSADVRATTEACVALQQSGDFVTSYEPRTNTCLICNIGDWTASTTSGGACAAFHGKWNWRTDSNRPPIVVHADGKFSRGGSVSGSWTCSGSTITVDWSKGFIDVLTLSANGKSMSGSGRRKNSSRTYGVSAWR